METICNNIYSMRLKKKFTQEFMADQLSISQAHYSKLERGSKKLSLEMTLKIAKILEMELKDIFDTE